MFLLLETAKHLHHVRGKALRVMTSGGAHMSSEAFDFLEDEGKQSVTSVPATSKCILRGKAPKDRGHWRAYVCVPPLILLLMRSLGLESWRM